MIDLILGVVVSCCMKYFLLGLFVCVSLYAESGYKISEFQIKNFLRESYFVTIEADNAELLNKLKIPLDKNEVRSENTETPADLSPNIRFKIGKIDARRIKKSAKFKDKILKLQFELMPSEPLPEGEPVVLEMSDTESKSVLATREYKIPKRNSEKGKQPFINRVYPAGGTVGDTINVLGTNLGGNVDDVFVQYVKAEPNGDFPFDEEELERERAYYLAPSGEVDKKTKEGLDLVRFTIPEKLMNNLEEELTLYEKIFGKEIHFYLYVNNRPTSVHSLKVLMPFWKVTNILLSITITILFLLSVNLVSRKWNFLPDILIDPRTNSYRLANFQAFGWTITIIGCYFYVAVGKMLILRDGELPDLNFDLIALLGISYGGLVTTNYMESKKPENRLKNTEPKLLDLISGDNDKIDMAKLQLFGFTLLGILVYIANLISGDSLLGLPGIPPTFLTLMLGSQGGYLSSRYVNEPLSVNFIEPSSFPLGSEKAKITLVGAGFTDGMKVMIKDHPPIAADVTDSNTLSVELSLPASAGKIDLVLIPKLGASVTLAEAIEVTEKPTNV